MTKIIIHPKFTREGKDNFKWDFCLLKVEEFESDEPGFTEKTVIPGTVANCILHTV